MRYLLLTILLLSGATQSYAWNPFGESGFKSKLSSYSATPTSIKNSACLGIKAQSRRDVLRKLQSLTYGDQIESYSMIFGLIIKDESKILVEALKHVLRGYKSAHSINCSTALCAVSAVFGRENGPRILYLMARYGVNTSYLTKTSYITYKLPASPWTTQELDTITSTLADLPESIFPLREAINLSYRNQDDQLNPKSVTHGLAVSRDQSVVLFPSWRRLNKLQQKAVVLHEFAHVIDYKIRISQSSIWTNFSKWKLDGSGRDRYGEYDQFVSKYSFTNSYEDFAEAVTAYRYNHALLKEVSPAKYQYIKEVIFGGIEFDQEESCDVSKSYFEVEVDPSESPFDYPMCTQDLQFYAYIGKAKKSLDECVYNSVVQSLLSFEGNLPANLKYKKEVQRNRQNYSYPRVTYNDFYKEDIDELVQVLVESYKNFP